MPDPAQTLTFLAWQRERLSDLVTGQTAGRGQAATTATLTLKAADGRVLGAETRAVPFFLAGPADVLGLGRGAIVRRYPSPGTVDHESDRCPYIELAEPSLPWRYTLAVTPDASSANLHPWLVLLVGEEGSELTLVDDRVTIAPAAQRDAQALGAPSDPYRFAHVQVDGAGHQTARVLCGRALRPGTDYLAMVVPAYDELGTRSWTGEGPASVPVYDAWRFRTAVPAGSFEDLAARLRPGDAPATTGRARRSTIRDWRPRLSLSFAARWLPPRQLDRPLTIHFPRLSKRTSQACSCPRGTVRADRSSPSPVTARLGAVPYRTRASGHVA